MDDHSTERVAAQPFSECIEFIKVDLSIKQTHPAYYALSNICQV